ncbi:hypothetical protein V8F33_013490 [Rhypophila sp. PSN 637]
MDSRSLAKAKNPRETQTEIKTIHPFLIYIHHFIHACAVLLTEISQKTGYSNRQIQTAVNGPVTPQKHRQHHNLLTIKTPDRRRLKEWLQTGRNRYIPICRLRYHLPPPLNNHGDVALNRALQELGGRSVFRPRRLPLTDQQKAARKAWSIRQLELRPRPVHWEFVHFSDETWVKADFMWKQRAILFDDEDPENIPDFAVKKRSKMTTTALQRTGIPVLRFPAYAPDLAPIENLWPWLKAWMEDNFDIQAMGSQELRPVIQAAWDAIPGDLLLRLAHSMPERLQKCIQKEGNYIDY